jgi:hypothetical protein
VADANLDQNRASRHEFCEFMLKFSGVLRMSNRGLLSCDSDLREDRAPESP